MENIKPKVTIENIKKYIPLIVTLTLIASYFSCIGYYAYYGINISTYLSLEDLTLIYLKWIWLSVLYVILVFITLYEFTRFFNPGKSWFDKKIGNTRLKRWIIVIIPVLIALSYLLYIFNEYLTLAIEIVFYGIGILLMFLLVIGIIIKIKNDKNNTLKDWFNIVFGTFFISCAFPFFTGLIFARYYTPENELTINFNDLTSLKINNNDHQLIGRTSSFIFIKNVKGNTITTYRVDNINNIELEHN